ncbi:hypothetical protein PF001_g18860 [Phytophthora fragariae]|uniref:Chromo domain-containing protein n=1 Tax=Phytophthora fragariae TaxID=53985 RepID=A0A6A3SP27_9STRA|nr:hypothetical protein PF006_g18027 [Phytophthora fragariae]KAE9292115.1 hypothetical protein PF001_g18860 [Phytophthora fragariae]
MYADESLDITDELLEHVAAQGIILAVNELKDHRWNAATNDYEIRVSWKGLQAIEDSYEPVQSLVKEIRVLVDNYVSKAKDSMLTEYSQKLQGGAAETDVGPPSKHSRPTSVSRSRVSASTASPAPTRKDQQETTTTGCTRSYWWRLPRKQHQRDSEYGCNINLETTSASSPG